MLRPVTCQQDLDELVAESDGGVITFQLLGGNFGKDVFTAAKWDHSNGDAARDLLSMRSWFIGYAIFALPSMVRCAVCGGPFTIEEEKPVVLLVHAAIPRPTLCHASGICGSCGAMDAGQLQRQIIEAHQTMFPGLRALPVTGDVGHA